MDKQLKKFLTIPVIYKKFTQRKGNGDSEFADGITVKVFIIPKSSVITSATGVLIVSSDVMYIDCSDVADLSGSDTFIVYNKVHTIKSFSAIVNEKGTNEVWEVHI